MAFEAVLCFPDRKPPVRAYIHSAGFRDTYEGRVNKVRSHILETLDGLAPRIGDFQYIIAAAWGDPDQARMIDFFGYKLSDNWRGNPDVHVWSTQDSGFSEHVMKTPLTCGDMTIVLGLEEQHRRKMPDVDEFMLIPPNIGDLLLKL